MIGLVMKTPHGSRQKETQQLNSTQPLAVAAGTCTAQWRQHMLAEPLSSKSQITFFFFLYIRPKNITNESNMCMMNFFLRDGLLQFKRIQAKTAEYETVMNTENYFRCIFDKVQTIYEIKLIQTTFYRTHTLNDRYW